MSEIVLCIGFVTVISLLIVGLHLVLGGPFSVAIKLSTIATTVVIAIVAYCHFYMDGVLPALLRELWQRVV